MSDQKYVMVPVEPTPEMIEAAREFHEGEPYLPVSLYKAMLAAAPQPAAARQQAMPGDREKIIDVLMSTTGISAGVTADAILSILTAAPAAPDVQGEPVAWQRVDRPDRIVTDLSHRLWKEVDDGVEFRALYAVPQAEQQPDITQLVEALEKIANLDNTAYHSIDLAKITARTALAQQGKDMENDSSN